MKWIIWAVGGVLAAIWTGAMALVALAIDWTGQALQQAGSTPAAALPLPADLPGWFARWIDPAGMAAIGQAVQQALDGVQAMLPAIGTATGWLEPLVWILWGFGMIALLTAAAGSHWLVARRAGTSAAKVPRLP